MKRTSFGAWSSPISSQMVASWRIRPEVIQLVGDDTYWIERRPSEDDRSVLVTSHRSGAPTDVLPPGFSPRSLIHDYGGGDYVVADNGIFFSNLADQRIYRFSQGSQPVPITPISKLRYGDLVADSMRKQLWCVYEDRSTGDMDHLTALATVSISGTDAPRIVASGHDFYAYPRLNPDGTMLAWLTWDLPNMPWDGSQIWVGEVGTDGTLGSPELVAGDNSESVGQPEWSPDGVLHFISERSGWWNLYRWDRGQVQAVCPMRAEFGWPLWLLGTSSYAFESSTRIACTYIVEGIPHLGVIGLDNGQLAELKTGFTEFGHFIRARPGHAVIVAGSPADPKTLIEVDIETGHVQVLSRGGPLPDPAYISMPRSIEFETSEGIRGHAFYYAPHNPDFQAPDGELPPLVVGSHGGPTGAAPTTMEGLGSIEHQYFTSRGFGYLDVNYRGSSGYGKAFRDALLGQYGVADVEDNQSAARSVMSLGLADAKRAVIRGSSASAFTVLRALSVEEPFRAGMCAYGVFDMERLVTEIHKFQRQYMQRMMASAPYPESRAVYEARSVLKTVIKPLLVIHGVEDRLTPIEHAESVMDWLRETGVPFATVIFQDEGHGIRRAKNLARAIEAELAFYRTVLGIESDERLQQFDTEDVSRFGMTTRKA